jgi:sugar phosphate isomerase/epimerase
MNGQMRSTRVALAASAAAFLVLSSQAEPAVRRELPKIKIAQDGRTFETQDGTPFVPFGINYFRPGIGWAPQVWKKFDAEATRTDFARMREVGVNCVRVFLSYGSFFMEPDALDAEGLARLDQFLEIAEAAGIYVYPTGPDHWEGTPEWAKTDRIAGEKVLSALETFWRLLAARYRDRAVIFAYDLRNEPEVTWNTAPMREKWNVWLEKKYGSADKLADAWGTERKDLALGQVPVPEAKDAPLDPALLEYQRFREAVADEWTRRQVAAIKSADPGALVAIGLIQWSVPSLLPRVSHYSGFRPERQAQFLDFMSIHFYPLNRGFYEYRDAEEESRNLAYLESVVREAASHGKPVIVGEFGWYGGGQPTINQGKHPAASEEQQARWCRKLVETTIGHAVGWLNWGFYDHPEARDVSQLTGLLTVEGQLKAWGQEFKRLSATMSGRLIAPATTLERPQLDWDLAITSVEKGNEFREKYYRSFTNRR